MWNNIMISKFKHVMVNN